MWIWKREGALLWIRPQSAIFFQSLLLTYPNHNPFPGEFHAVGHHFKDREANQTHRNTFTLTPAPEPHSYSSLA